MSSTTMHHPPPTIITTDYRHQYGLTPLHRIAQLFGDAAEPIDLTADTYEDSESLQRTLQFYRANQLIEHNYIHNHPKSTTAHKSAHHQHKTAGDKRAINGLYHTTKFVAAIKHRQKQRLLAQQQLIQHALDTEQCVLIRPLTDVDRALSRAAQGRDDKANDPYASIGITLDDAALLAIITRKYDDLQKRNIVHPDTLRHTHSFGFTGRDTVDGWVPAGDPASVQFYSMLHNTTSGMQHLSMLQRGSADTQLGLAYDGNNSMDRLNKKYRVQSQVKSPYTTEHIRHAAIMSKLAAVAAYDIPRTTPSYTQLDKHVYNVSLDPPKPPKVPVDADSKAAIEQRIQLQKFLDAQAKTLEKLDKEQSGKY